MLETLIDTFINNVKNMSFREIYLFLYVMFIVKMFYNIMFKDYFRCKKLEKIKKEKEDLKAVGTFPGS